MEIWKDIEGYEGLYQVSNTGKVKSFPNATHLKEKVLKETITKTGKYSAVTLYKEFKKKESKVHRLVAQAFIFNPENKREINHKDCNKQNNNDWNLEWNTSSENKIHAYDHDLMKKGEKNYSSILTEESVKEIRELRGKVSQRELSKRFKTCIQNICAIQLNKRWKHIN